METNLDSYIDSKDLMAFWARYHTNSRTIASSLFPDKPKGYVRTARDLANYASNKATAMRCRANGDITTALMYETICERIYNSLPQYAKW